MISEGDYSAFIFGVVAERLGAVGNTLAENGIQEAQIQNYCQKVRFLVMLEEYLIILVHRQ